MTSSYQRVNYRLQTETLLTIIRADTVDIFENVKIPRFKE